MKSLITLLLCFALAIILHSCRKEFLANNHYSKDELSIEEAKNFYISSQKLLVSKLMSTGGTTKDNNPSAEPQINPLWNQADTLTDNRFHVVELPVVESVKTASITNEIAGENLIALNDKPNGICRLIVVKDKNTEKMEFALMRLTAYTASAIANLKKNTYKHKESSFTGSVIFTTTDNRFINGWEYHNGKPTNSIRIARAFYDSNAKEKISVDSSSSISVKNDALSSFKGMPKRKIVSGRPNASANDYVDGAGGSDNSNYCGKVTDWYQRSCYYLPNGQLSCNEWVYRYSTFSVEKCEEPANRIQGVGDYQQYNSPTTNEGYVLMTPPNGNVGGTNPSNSDIISEFKDYPCAKALVEKMKTLNNDIATLIKNTFAKSDDVNLTFEPRPTLANTGVDGELISRSGTNFRVGINPDILNNATKEYILVTLYHEALHAYFMYKLDQLKEIEFGKQFLGTQVNGGRVLGVGDKDHWSMGYDKYVRGLKDAIISFNSTYNEDRAWALAKGGIVSLSPIEDNTNKQERNVNDSNHPGATGTKCPK